MGMSNTTQKVEGHVNVFCKSRLWKALDAIHREYGVNKSEILMSFIEHHFVKDDDLLVGVLEQVEKNLQNKLAEIQAAKKDIGKTKPIVQVINNFTEPKPKPVVKYKKSDFAVGLEEALQNVDTKPTEEEQEEIDLVKVYDSEDLNFNQFRFKRYEDLEHIGILLKGSKFINSPNHKSKFKNGFFASQASQALDMWRDGATVAEICKKQPIQFMNQNTGQLDVRPPTIQTMFRRLVKQIHKFGRNDEKQKLFYPREYS